MMSVSTEASLRLASSSVFWMRWTWEACSRTSCLRVRSRSRIARVPASGTKLGRIRPCASRSESQTASATSVLRPGTFFTCAALARISVRLLGGEHLPDRAPVDAGRLHGDARAAVALQPVRQGEEPRRGGREGLDLPPDRPVALDQPHRRDDGVLVHVQPRTAGMQNLHRDLLEAHAADAGSREVKV